MSISRRNFLTGSAACAVAAALPVAAAESLLAPYHCVGPIFEGSVGVYQGVIIREVYDLNACARSALREWVANKPRLIREFDIDGAD